MFLLGILGNTDGQFVRLSNFSYQNQLSYFVYPLSFYQEFSGALFFDMAHCRNSRCPIILDKDFVVAQDNKIASAMQSIQRQSMRFDPEK